MRKLSVCLATFFLLSHTCSAQDSTATRLDSESKNVIKLNVPALVLRNYSVQYERKIASKFSASVSLRYIPFGNLPLQQHLSKLVNSEDIDLNDFKFGSFGVLPEIRFYPGRKGALRGFYLGAFGNYSTYKAELPINLDDENAILKGNVTAMTGGLQIGFQNKISKRIYLDIWILGPNFGKATGNLMCIRNFTADEQEEMAQNIEDIKTDLPFDFIKSYEVNNNGAKINIDGPWGGIRGLGINLGIRI